MSRCARTPKPGSKAARHPALISVFIAALAHFWLGAGAAAQPIIVQSTFDANVEGWSVATYSGAGPFTISGSFPATWNSTGGNPGGYVRQTDPDGNYSYWRAPAAYFGNLSGAYGGTLSYDLLQAATDSQSAAAPDVVLQGGGLTLILKQSYNPETRWTRYHALLAPGGGWKVSTLGGADASGAQILQALTSATGLFLRAEFRDGVDTDDLDNVIIRAPSTLPTTSRFDADGDGWWVRGDAGLPSWIGAGGNPGGFLQATDLGVGQIWYFLAPPKFLGTRSSLLGGTIEVDLLLSANELSTGDPLCVVAGAGMRLEFAGAVIPGLNWTHYSIPIGPAAGWVRQPGGAAASAEDFVAVFASVTELSIRGEWSLTFDTGSLDNVALTATGGCQPCDTDCNGTINPFDIQPFLGLLGPTPPTQCSPCAGDANNDGTVNPFDISAFLQCLGS